MLPPLLCCPLRSPVSVVSPARSEHQSGLRDTLSSSPALRTHPSAAAMSFALPEDDGYFAQQQREQQAAAQPQLLLLPSTSEPAAPPPVVIDALPYVDDEYAHPDIKARVHALITQEMHQSSTPLAQYAASIHTLPALAAIRTLQPGHTSPAATLAPLSTRHIEQSFPSPPVPLASLTPPRPASPPADASAEQLALHLQYLQSTDVHLQLLRHYGPQHSNLATQALKQRKAELEGELQRETSGVESVNRVRRSRQLEVGERLRWLDGEWWRLVENVSGMRRRMGETGESDGSGDTQMKRTKAAVAVES